MIEHLVQQPLAMGEWFMNDWMPGPIGLADAFRRAGTPECIDRLKFYADELYRQRWISSAEHDELCWPTIKRDRAVLHRAA